MKAEHITIMSFKKIVFYLFFSLLVTSWAMAQDNRTEGTRVADVLTLLPAKDKAQGDRLYQEMLKLSDQGLDLIAKGVKPSGNPEGVTARFAVSLLTHHASSGEERRRIEQAYIRALQQSTDNEVKAYFITNLQRVGSNDMVSVLAPYLSDAQLADPAIGALKTLASPPARTALTDALKNAQPDFQYRLVKALGFLQHKPAVPLIAPLANSTHPLVKKESLWALGMIGDPSSAEILLGAAKTANYKTDKAQSMEALVEYLNQVTRNGQVATVKTVSQALLTNCNDASQFQYRLAGLNSLAAADPQNASPVLIKEWNSSTDAEYQKEVLKAASPLAKGLTSNSEWVKLFYKSTGTKQADLLAMLSKANRDEKFVSAYLAPALSSKNAEVKKVAVTEMANSGSDKFNAELVQYLLNCKDAADIELAKKALLRAFEKKECGILAGKLEAASPTIKVTLLQILSERRATDQFSAVLKFTQSTDAPVRQAAYQAIPNVSVSEQIPALMDLLKKTTQPDEIKLVQQGMIAVMDEKGSALVEENYSKEKTKLLPVLPYITEPNAIQWVMESFNTGSDQDKKLAFEALTNWQSSEAIRPLVNIRKDNALKAYHEAAFTAFIAQIKKSTWPDDQKLLQLKEMMALTSNAKEKSSLLLTAGSVRTFLSLMFVSPYIEQPEVGSAAARAAMQIALPTADAKPGLTGTEVRKVLERIMDKLKGQDSPYEQIDIKTYLDAMPKGRGYESIFNGKNLDGWQGLVGNPLLRAKMTKEELAKKQAEANAKVKDNWSVRDECIYFSGKGENLCTVKPYGDFEMYVDWKISKDGDSGLYLRGTPQVQIWDPARTDVGAQVGSGGLYNNKKGKSTPLVFADNPVGDWNTFYIKMVGEKVTVYLNGTLVVDNVTLENYWDSNLPIFAEDAIELQAHGTELAFRNLYVNELGSKPFSLSAEEKAEGFDVLFDGDDLDKWIGNKTDYIIEDNTMVIYAAKESHGNIYTQKEYSDFVFRFEFQLTPGANNGVGIHAPLEGDAAYVAKEIQILDDPAPVYADLKEYQFHGSVYGVIPAKKGFLKPVGEWNQEEIYVKGDYIKVTLNGTVILEGDMAKASKKGTLDHKDHPGLKRHTGHIGFLGHGTTVRFRKIRIKEIKK